MSWYLVGAWTGSSEGLSQVGDRYSWLLDETGQQHRVRTKQGRPPQHHTEVHIQPVAYSDPHPCRRIKRRKGTRLDPALREVLDVRSGANSGL
jgi:hypothetical protein